MSLWHNRNFAMLLIARGISVLGDSLGGLAIGWLVYEITGSKVAMGSLMISLTVSMSLVRLFGGPLVDRMDRRLLMVITDWARAVLWIAAPVLHWLGVLEIWHLYAMAVLEGATAALFDPAVMSVVPNLVSRDQLDRANGLLESVMQLMMLLGPALAGVLVTWVGSDFTLFANGITFVVSAIGLSLLPQIKAARTGAEKKNWWHESAEGWLFFRKTPVLLWLLALVSFSNLAASGTWVLFVPWTQEVLHVDAWFLGLFQSSFSGGIAVGALLAPLVIERIGRRVSMISGLTIGALFTALMGLVVNPWVLIGFAICGGLAIPLWNVCSNSIYQERVPDELRGRVYSLRVLMAQGTQPIGTMLGTWGAVALSIPATFVILNLAQALVALTGLFVPALHTINRPIARSIEGSEAAAEA